MVVCITFGVTITVKNIIAQLIWQTAMAPNCRSKKKKNRGRTEDPASEIFCSHSFCDYNADAQKK